MTSKEFVNWMQGFVEACNDYSPTPKQWDALKDKLGEVKDEPIQTLPFIQPYDPYNPYKITSESGTTITTTPGIGGTITYNPSTTTYATPQSGSWHYTSTLPQQQTTGSNQLELEFESK